MENAEIVTLGSAAFASTNFYVKVAGGSGVCAGQKINFVLVAPRSTISFEVLYDTARSAYDKQNSLVNIYGMSCEDATQIELTKKPALRNTPTTSSSE